MKPLCHNRSAELSDSACRTCSCSVFQRVTAFSSRSTLSLGSFKCSTVNFSLATSTLKLSRFDLFTRLHFDGKFMRSPAHPACRSRASLICRRLPRPGSLGKMESSGLRNVPFTSVACFFTLILTTSTCPCLPLYCPSCPWAQEGYSGTARQGKRWSTTRQHNQRAVQRPLTDLFNAELSMDCLGLLERAADSHAAQSSSIKPQSRHLRDQLFHASIDGAERIHTENRFFPIAIELQIGPVDRVGAILRSGKPDKIAAHFRARRLRRHRHRPLNRVLFHHPFDQPSTSIK